MKPSEVFADAFFNIKLVEFESEIDLIVEIALVTENGSYDTARSRDHLLYLKKRLTEVLKAAYSIAEKQRQRLITKEERLTRQGDIHKLSVFTQPENSASMANDIT